MTVRQLIELLQTLPDNSPVFAADYEGELQPVIDAIQIGYPPGHRFFGRGDVEIIVGGPE
jgi:hypothetical protein